jgi:phage terminase Nu1 subunit (DNA packaging protein)
MVELGIDWKTASLNEIRVAYIRRLREQAAGRAAVGDLDLAGERAALAKVQRERIEMQNAVTRGELAPVVLIEEVLTKAASKTAGILDAIPGMIRRRVPVLTADDIGLIAGEVAKARNMVAAMSLADLTDAADSADVSTTGPEPIA